ncbi:MAG TPA: histidinol dehydrogenase [Vicinamibacterales bacterium]|jgi:histidinol dehydrogenase
MRIVESTNARAIARLTSRLTASDAAVDRRVRQIVERVRRGGDRALVALSRRFDGLSAPIEVTRDEIDAGASQVAPDVRLAIRRAARNIARVAFRQLPKHFDLDVEPGVSIEQRIEPLERVGCYVPAGRFPLPSSLLMTAVPARVAGVREVILMCPRPEPVVLAAAQEAGVTRLFRVGGAQAIAALAYGTETIPRVDKIVGPGNRYVAAAKALIAGALADCAIDFHAGPTEIVVVAGSGRADWVAADLAAQAEHDPDARSILVTWRRAFARDVERALARLTKGRRIVEQSLRAHGAAIVAADPDEAMTIANRLAPEHLVVESDALIRRPVVAGAVFVGPWSAQAAGDYATGSNHVLPTAGAARVRGGLSAADFVRVMSVQRISRAGLTKLAETIVPLARAEGLQAHAESIEIRISRRKGVRRR